MQQKVLEKGDEVRGAQSARYPGGLLIMKRVTNFIAVYGNKVCANKKFWKKEMGFGEEENNLFQKVFSSSPKKKLSIFQM